MQLGSQIDGQADTVAVMRWHGGGIVSGSVRKNVEDTDVVRAQAELN